jgi:NAD+ synthase (glutamine-hydrolysing)
MIVVNGKVVAQGSQFSLNDVEVITAVVDLEEVRAYRFAPSRGLQSIQAPTYQRIETPFALSSESNNLNPYLAPSPSFDPKYHSAEAEIALSTGCWLWDYLRRSGSAGYLVSTW